MIKAFFAALFETIAEVIKTIVREDKKGQDAQTEKSLRDRWERSLRDRLRDDENDLH